MTDNISMHNTPSPNQNPSDQEPQAEHTSQPGYENSPQEALFTALGVSIEPNLLVEALTHKSFSNEHPGVPCYERLEFLGDAVLELVTTSTLYSEYPQLNEGTMTKIRASVVNQEALARIARQALHLGQYVILGQGERDDHGADKDSILSDVVEALIGASYAQYGYEQACAVVHRLIDESLHATARSKSSLDWKTSLIVKCHELKLPDPEYTVVMQGPDYAPEFSAQVYIGESTTPVASGTGSSKRKAQLKAAEQAWHELNARGRRRA